MTEQKQREHELERQTGHLTALNQATQVMTSNLSLYEVLQDILNSASNVVEGQGASLFLVNKDNLDELVVVAAVGYHANDLIGLRVPLGEGLAGWVAREAQSQLVADLKNDPRFYKGVDEQTGISSRSLIAVPLVHANQVIGVVEVVNKLNNGVFDDEDVRLLESMAGTAAVSIMNARLYDQAQRRVSELATLLDASEAASSTLELASVLEHITRSLVENFDVAQSNVMAWHNNQLVSLAEVSDAHWPDTEGPLQTVQAGTTTYTALITGQPAIAKLHDRHLHADDRAMLEESGMATALVVPIQQGNATIGIVRLTSDARSAYRDQDITTIQAHLQRWITDTGAGTPLGSLPAPELTQLTTALIKHPATCWVTIHAWSPGNTAIRLIRETGSVEWTRRSGPSLNLDAHPTMNQVIEKRHIAQIHLHSLDQESSEHQWLTQRGGHAALMIPLLLHGVAIGLVMMIDTNERIFDDEEIDLAQGIANVVSSAIDNARLYQSLQSRAKALENAYSELQEADKAKDQFIQNVSHELRTPLIHVMGYAELLADDTFGTINVEQREALNTISGKSQQIANIVDDMVAVQTQEERSFDLQPIDIIELIQRACTANQVRIERAGLALATHFPDQAPPIMADAAAITEVFDKLLDNALKFGAESDRIEVQISDTDGPMVRVAIRDHGIGIPQSEQAKIFQRFYQVDGSATRRYGGTGLGLAVAKMIIEGHGGKIGLTSQPGEGSIFFFYLPKRDLNHKKSSGYLTEKTE